MVMQIFQHRLMWYFNLLTAAGALLVAVFSNVWAQVFMNSYFIVMALIGIAHWKKLSSESGRQIHIVDPSKKTIITAAAFVLIGAPIVCTILAFTNDPSPYADGISMTLSLVAAWFLTRSHSVQWFLWMAGDVLLIVVYAGTGAWWMVALYYCYIVASCFGYRQWITKGVKVKA